MENLNEQTAVAVQVGQFMDEGKDELDVELAYWKTKTLRLERANKRMHDSINRYQQSNFDKRYLPTLEDMSGEPEPGEEENGPDDEDDEESNWDDTENDVAGEDVTDDSSEDTGENNEVGDGNDAAEGNDSSENKEGP